MAASKLAMVAVGVWLAGAEATNKEGLEFLEKNKGSPGVVTRPSGLQYKILKTGQGASHPLPSTPCKCHYEGRTAGNHPNGVTFDSSYSRGSPTTFAPNQVIKGWTEAMQLMVEGDKWELYIPAELGYGAQGAAGGKIGPGDVLVFTLELIEIMGDGVPASKCDVATREQCSDKETAFLDKWAPKAPPDWAAEVQRLESMVKSGHVVKASAAWMETRLKLLGALLAAEGPPDASKDEV